MDAYGLSAFELVKSQGSVLFGSDAVGGVRSRRHDVHVAIGVHVHEPRRPEREDHSGPAPGSHP